MKKKELKELCVELIHANALLFEHNVDLRGELDESQQAVLPEVEGVILNGPATVVKWDDGTKTVSKLRDGDEYDPLFGILACTVRKLTGNRDHMVDCCENDLRNVCTRVKGVDEIEELRDYNQLLTDTLTVLLDNRDKWLDQLGKPEPVVSPEPAAKPETVVASVSAMTRDRVDELEERLEQTIREREAMRQKLRDLIDAGEL